MTAEFLIEIYGYWNEHPLYTHAKWVQEVMDANTLQGYWHWVERQIDADENYQNLMLGEGDEQEDS